MRTIEENPSSSRSSLRALAPDVWTTERSQRFFGLEVGTRMTVIRLGDGSLFVHSPVTLDAETRRAMDSLGSIGSVVAPNLLHHLYVGQYFGLSPATRVYAAPSLAAKRRDLPFHGTLGDEPEPAWAGDVDQLWVRGVPALNEVVFLHRKSGTLILTDLAFNVQHASSFASRLFLQLDGAYGRFGVSRIARLFFRDKRAARASIDRVLGWDLERIVVAHGDVLETDAKETLRRAFAWL